MRTTAELLSHLNKLGIKLWDDDGYLGFSAPKGALTRSLRKELVAHKAKILELLRQAKQPTLVPEPIEGRQAVPEPVEGRPLTFRLSHGQEALWFVYQNAPESAAYNTSLPLHIQDALDVPVLRQALQRLVERHPALRTTFTSEGEVPMQEVQQASQFILEEVDAASWTWDELMEEVTATHQRPFDLERGPIFRATLFTFAPQNHILLLSMHHITGDAASFSILLNELLQLYAAPASVLRPLQVSYADYVRAQSDLLGSSRGKRLQNYWQTQLAGDIPQLNLLTDHPRPAVQSYNGASYLFSLNAELTEQLKALAGTAKTTLFTTLLAAYQVLLHRYTGQDDIWVGSPTGTGRNQPEFSQIVGYLVNPVVLRARFPQDERLSFRSFLNEVRQTVLDAIEHQAYPFPLLVQQLQPERHASTTPLFQTMFVLEASRLNNKGPKLQGSSANSNSTGHLSVSIAELNQMEGQFDLTLTVSDGEVLACGLRYNADLFEASTIERMAGHFQTLLAAIVANPEQAITHLPLLTEAERHQILVEWNDTAVEYPKDKGIHHLFEQQVERTPDEVAVIYEGQQLTYRELNARANQLAHYLQALGVVPETLVGIYMERSLDMVVALLGILKAGGAYLPLHLAYPSKRLAFLIEDAAPTILLTQSKHAASLPDDAVKLVALDVEWAQIAQQPVSNPTSTIIPDNLAYVIYTSGSTGQPKGVLIEHRGLCNSIASDLRTFDLAPGSRFLHATSFTFDAATSHLFMTLCAGAAIVIAPHNTILLTSEPSGPLAEQRITHTILPSAMLGALPVVNLPKLKVLGVGGSICTSSLVEVWCQGRRMFNIYGPTEATITTTIGKCVANGRKPSIGQPIANMQVYILDQFQQPQPVGVAGELYIGGIGVARGYLNRPNLTEERFVKNPFLSRHASVTTNPSIEGRLYKTGDFARWLPDGNVDFLGRIDHQIKVRGFRIELGEIESVLRKAETVQETVVIARQNQRAEKQLVAYVVPRERSDAETTIPQLRAHLKERLPDYMVPAAIVILDALPLTPNGKVDQRALPAPDASTLMRQAYIEPRNASERVLAEIWSEALQVAPIGMDDNFFDLGGHSLLATRVMANIKSQLGKKLPISSLFQAPTIREFASLLIEAPPSQPWSAVVPIQPVGEKTAFFCLPGGAAHPLYLWELARHLGPEQPFYGLQLPGYEGKRAPITQMHELVTHFLHAIRQTQPKGPYLLGGHSSGGHIALALALALQKQGEAVPAVVILDSIAPGITLPEQPMPAQKPKANRLMQMVLAAKEALGDKFTISLAHLQRLKGEAAWNYALDAYKKAKLLPPQAKVTQLKKMNQVYASVGEALKGFAPQEPYQGKLLFFQTSEIPFKDPQQIVAGWQAVCTNRIEVHPVPGNHNSMLNAPHVQVLAKKLRDAFDRTL